MRTEDKVRKREREVSDRDRLLAALDTSPFGYLAMADGGRPYVVPISFVRGGNAIFLHCAKIGKKVDFITASPRVSFCVTPIANYIRGKMDFEYLSVYVEGLARLVQDRDEKVHAYELLVKKYEPGNTEIKLSDACVDASSIICIDISTMTGKENAPADTPHKNLF